MKKKYDPEMVDAMKKELSEFVIDALLKEKRTIGFKITNILMVFLEALLFYRFTVPNLKNKERYKKVKVSNKNRCCFCFSNPTIVNDRNSRKYNKTDI